jgi:hypothetical protein
MPTYLEMSVKAIKALKDRTGSSSAAIKSFIVENETVAFGQHSLRRALAKGVESGLLVMIARSYMITDKVRRAEKVRSMPLSVIA